MKKNELLYVLALQHVAKIGDVTAKKLISHCGSAEAVFKEKKSNLLRIDGIGEFTISNLFDKTHLIEAEKELDFMEKNFITPRYFKDENYPERLKQCIDAPIVLFEAGQIDLDNPHIIRVLIEHLYQYINEIFPLINELEGVFKHKKLEYDGPLWRKKQELNKDNIIDVFSSFLENIQGFDGRLYHIESDEKEILDRMNQLYKKIFNVPYTIECLEVDDIENVSVFIKNYCHYAYSPLIIFRSLRTKCMDNDAVDVLDYLDDSGDGIVYTNASFKDISDGFFTGKMENFQMKCGVYKVGRKATYSGMFDGDNFMGIKRCGPKHPKSKGYIDIGKMIYDPDTSKITFDPSLVAFIPDTTV